MSAEDRFYPRNEHAYSVKPSSYILNALTPASIRSAEKLIVSGSVAEQLIDMRLVTGDPLFTFHSYSFYTPVPIFFTIGTGSLATANDQRHFFEGGRFTITSTSPLTCLKFRAISPPAQDVTIYLMVG